MNNMKKNSFSLLRLQLRLHRAKYPKGRLQLDKKGLDVASAQLQLSAEEINGTGDVAAFYPYRL